MNIPSIRPIILSGGFGTRLWPLSSHSHPKQFTRFFDETPNFFALTLQRFSDETRYLPPFIIGNIQHLGLIQETLSQLKLQNAVVIAEPVSCNTAAAALVAALLEEKKDIFHLLVPSDHHIEDEDSFHHLVAKAHLHAEQERIMLFGITPNRPETGYGYIMPKKTGETEIKEIEKFLEKPDKCKASSLIAQGALWNSGMFLYQLPTLLTEIIRINSDYYSKCREAVESHSTKDNCIFLDEQKYKNIPSAAFDTLVMENTLLGSVIAGSFGWCDVGSWESLWAIARKDQDNNLIKGDVITRDVGNSYICSDGIRIAALGMQDCIIVARNNTVLISPLDKSQEVKYFASLAQAESAAPQLRERAAEPYAPEPLYAEGANTTHWRPWGEYENVAKGKNYLVKHLTINPGCCLSLQKHEERTEHWVMMEGEATVELEGETKIFYPNDAICIPKSALHRLKNESNSVVKIIEIQSGNYLNEDDITRYEDMFGRV